LKHGTRTAMFRLDILLFNRILFHKNYTKNSLDVIL